MLCTEHGHSSNDIGSAVLGQSFGNDFQGSGDLTVRQLSDALDVVGHLLELVTDLHFYSSSTGDEEWIEADVSCDVDGILDQNKTGFKQLSGLCRDGYCLHQEKASLVSMQSQMANASPVTKSSVFSS